MSRKRQRKRQGSRHGAVARGRDGAGARRRAPSRAKRRRRLHFVLGMAFVVAVLAALWWVSSSRERDFAALAAGGRGALQARVVTEPSAGRSHDTRAGDYGQRFPTSGEHHPNWIDPGVYSTRQPPARLVHSLEHGNIVIYYDQPGGEVLERLRAWAALHDGPWSGIVVTPAPGLGRSVVLTAWTKRLRLDEFEPELAAAFIDAYRGRGPENPVR